MAATPAAMPIASTAATGSAIPRLRAERRSIAKAAAAPPIRPPRWPPIETFGITNPSARLIRMSAPRPDRIGSIPRAYWSTKAAPMSPKTAPEAPTVTAWGDNSSAPNEPATSEVK